MKHARKAVPPATDGCEIFDDFEALTALVQKSFLEAAQAAVAENDRLGIPTHGSIGGKLVVRQPRQKAPVPAHR